MGVEWMMRVWEFLRTHRWAFSEAAFLWVIITGSERRAVIPELGTPSLSSSGGGVCFFSFQTGWYGGDKNTGDATASSQL